MVVRHRPVNHRVDARVSRSQRRILQRENATSLSVGRGGTGTRGRQAVLTGDAVPRNVDLRIDFAVIAPDVSALIAQVTDRRPPGGPNLPLIRGIPVGYIRRLGVDGTVDVNARGREESPSVGRKWIPARIVLPRIGKSAHRIRNVDG